MIGEWLHLPFNKNQLNDCLVRININEQYEEYFFSDYECSISEILRILGEYENIFILNKLAEQLLELDDYELEKLKAVLEYDSYSSVFEVINVTYSLDDFIFYANIENEEELGRYFVEEENLYYIPDSLDFYIDYESMGRDLAIGYGGIFVNDGFVYGDGVSIKRYEEEQEIIDEQR